MPRTIKILCAMLFFGLMTGLAQDPMEPGDQPPAATTEPVTTGALAILGQPFSAIKYSRTVKIMPDGTQQVIRNEQYSVQVARDAKGRVLLQTGPFELAGECNQQDFPKSPKCAGWGMLLYDPGTQTMNHWAVVGPKFVFYQVIIQMTPVQVAEAEELTLNIHQNMNQPEEEDSSVTWESLGQKQIEGVTATGVRTTTEQLPESSGKAPSKTIHEVWVSQEMKLVLRVIDGDPHGVETISGLEHLSLSPDPSMFIPDGGVVMRFGLSDLPGEAYSGGEFHFKNRPGAWGDGDGPDWSADGDIRDLAEWEVK